MLRRVKSYVLTPIQREIFEFMINDEYCTITIEEYGDCITFVAGRYYLYANTGIVEGITIDLEKITVQTQDITKVEGYLIDADTR